MEVQKHGVVFEDEVIFQITGKRKAEYEKLLPGAYTSSLDIAKGIQSDYNYSIKVCKDGKTIGCGDLLRFYRHCRDTEFIIVVGCWQQVDPTTKRYYLIYEFTVTSDDFNKFWGDIKEEHLVPFVEWVKSIPEGKDAQLSNRKCWKQKRRETYQHGRGLVSIDAKIDSKTQRRVQCSVKLAELIKNGIPHIKYTTDYKGIKLPYEQISAPRTFS
jgi:hypothetical protein